MSHCGYAFLNHPGNGNRGCWQEAMSKREENHDGKQAGSLSVRMSPSMMIKNSLHPGMEIHVNQALATIVLAAATCP